MRTMVRVTMKVDTANALIKSGRMPQLMGDMMGRLKPEAAYFTADGGNRTAYLFIDMKDPSELVTIGEPFFQEMNAKVEFMPVMNADDLKKGLSQLK